MFYVIDLINTNDVTETTQNWEKVCEWFAQQEGYFSGRLLQTIETIHPTDDFKLTSVVSWESEDAWISARQSAKSNSALSKPLSLLSGKFTAFNGRQVQGSKYNPAYDSEVDEQEARMVLVDVIYLTKDRMQPYADMWSNANVYMQDKPGYVGANLFATSDPNNPIKYINLAEWESKEIFFQSLSTPEFMQIIDDFKDDFALYLSKVVKKVPPISHKVEVA